MKTTQNRRHAIIFLSILLAIFCSMLAVKNFSTGDIGYFYNVYIALLFLSASYLSYRVYILRGKETSPIFYLIIVTTAAGISILGLDILFHTYRVAKPIVLKEGIIAVEIIWYLAMLIMHSRYHSRKGFESAGNYMADSISGAPLSPGTKYFSFATFAVSPILFVVMMTLIYLTHSIFISLMFNSDSSNVYYVYKEVILNGVPFRDIYTFDQKSTMTLPYCLYFLGAAIAGDFYYAQLMNAILQSVLFLAVGFYVVRLVYKKTEAIYLFPFIVLSSGIALVCLPATSGRTFASGFYDLDIRGFHYPIWMPDYHFVQTSLLALLSFALFLHYFSARTSTGKGLMLCAFIVTSLLGGGGNALFLVYSTSPLFLTVLYLWLIKKMNRADTLIWLAGCLSSVLLQRLLSKAIIVSAGALVDYTGISITYIRENIPRIGSMFLANILAQPVLMAGFFILVMAGLWTVLFRFHRMRKESQIEGRTILLILLLFSTGCIISAELMSKMVRERYTAGILFYSLVIFVAVFGKYIIGSGAKVKTMLLAVVLVFFLYEIIHFAGKEIHTTYYPDENRCIDEIAEKYNVTNGIAPYWLAHQTEMISKKGLTVAPTKDCWVYKFWLSERDIKKRYNFILSTDAKMTDHYHVDPDNIRKYYGEPDYTEICGNINVYIYKNSFKIQERM